MNPTVRFTNKTLSLLVLVLLASAGALSQNQAMRLTSIEFRGLVRVSKQQALDASGLHIGDYITIDSLDLAAKRLSDSGLFGKLGYRIRAVKDSATVTFDVEEFKGNIPVVFDNFVWFSEDELFNAVKADLPTFNGTAPESGSAVEVIRNALAKKLRAAGITGEVQAILATDANGSHPRNVFTVKGARVPICSVDFKGTRDVDEAVLVDKSKEIIGSDFSREIAGGFPEAGLLPTYKRLGHLRAVISLDTVKLDESPECKGGVKVGYLVDEGSVYTWGGSEWIGNLAFQADELSSVLGLKKGEVANIEKIEKGQRQVSDFYGRKGYMALIMQTVLLFDDRARQVSYQFKISEGPQYRMGNLTITGLPDSDAAKLKADWKLAEGETFDSSYPAGYVKKLVLPGDPSQRTPRKVELKITPVKESLTVNVEIAFK